MKYLPASSASKIPVKFSIPTSDNLIPIRLDIDIDGQRFRDAFTWNPNDPDSETHTYAKRMVKDLKLPQIFVTQISQSIQSQLADFRQYEGQDMHIGEKIVPIKLDLRVNHTLIKDHFLWDLNNFESDPEEFARNFCQDLGIEDPEVGEFLGKKIVTIGGQVLVEVSSILKRVEWLFLIATLSLFETAVDKSSVYAIREKLYEIAIQSVSSIKENRLNKKGRRGFELTPISKSSGAALDLMKLFGNRWSVLKMREWDIYEPIVDILSNEEVEALEAREERNARA